MAIQSLFGPSPEEIILARQQQAQQQLAARNQMIAQQGSQFGVFAPLYQAGLRFGDVASQAANQYMFPNQRDPMLERATRIQDVISKYSDQDTTDPSVLKKMSGDFAAMGLTREALTLAQDAKKAETEAKRLGFEEKRVGLEEERVSLTKRQVLLEEVNKDPYGSIQKALQMDEDDPTRAIILAGASARIGEKNFDQAVKQAQIDASKATAAKAAGPEVSESVVTEDGLPLTKKGGKYYKMDGTAYTGKIKKLTGPGEYDAILGQGAGAGAGAKKPPGERRPLGSFEPNSQQTTAPTEAAEPAVTKYTRSKGRGGSYIYTPSPRGLTMDEWNAQDR